MEDATSENLQGEDLSEYIKAQLILCLSEVDQAHSPATFATCPLAANPGIEVTGLGRIGLPLSTRDAEAIATLSHQAPFGKGTETIVDLEVRKTWELNVDQFKIENPSWQETLQEIVENVKAQLGVHSDVEAQPYKMLLYGDGAMFKPHKDSEKAPGMFGTLVVCLPSEHEGGQVHLSHGGKEMVFDTAKSSRFETSYLAWYADITHEIKPVTKGYRFVLTYNLVQEGAGVPPSAADADKKRAELQGIIKGWKTNYDDHTDGCPEVLAYMLDHKYTDANLGVANLKGQDLIRVRYLQDVCSQNGFSVFLVNVERQVSGTCDSQYDDVEWCELYERAVDGLDEDHHSLGSVESDYYYLTTVVSLQSSVTLRYVPMDEGNIVQQNLFSDGPDKEDWSGPTGNQGTTATHFYRSSAALLIPSDCVLDFFLNAYGVSSENPYLVHWMEQLIDKSSSSSEECFRTELSTVCQHVVATIQKRKYNVRRVWPFEWRGFAFADVLSKILKASVLLDDFELLKSTLSIVAIGISLESCSRIGHAIQHFGFENIQPLLDDCIPHDLKPRELGQALKCIVSGYKEKNKALPKPNELAGVESWAKKKLEETLDTPEFLKEDGKVFVDLMANASDIELPQRVLSAVELRPSNMEFATGFLNCVFQAREHGDLSEDMVMESFRRVLSRIIPSFTLYSVNEREKCSRPASSGWKHTLIETPDLAKLLHFCTILNLNEEFDKIVAEVAADTSRVNDTSFLKDSFRLLEDLCAFASAGWKNGKMVQRDDTLLQRFRPLAHILVDAFLNHLGEKPGVPAPNWVRTACGCGCDDCNQLDDFLLDPRQENKTLAFEIGHRRDHISSQLSERLGWERRELGVEHFWAQDTKNALEIRKTVFNKTKLGMWEDKMRELGKILRSAGDERMLRSLLGERYAETFEKIPKGY